MSQQLRQGCPFSMLSAAEVPLVAGQGQPRLTPPPQTLVLLETLAAGEAQQGQGPAPTPEATSCLLEQYEALHIKWTPPVSQHYLVRRSSLWPASAHTRLDGRR